MFKKKGASLSIYLYMSVPFKEAFVNLRLVGTIQPGGSTVELNEKDPIFPQDS